MYVLYKNESVAQDIFLEIMNYTYQDFDEKFVRNILAKSLATLYKILE